jgi:hypothetical protein
VHGCLSPASVVFYQVEVSAIGRSLVQKNPTECDVSVIQKSRRAVLGPQGLSSHEREKLYTFTYLIFIIPNAKNTLVELAAYCLKIMVIQCSLFIFENTHEIELRCIHRSG